MAIEDIPGGAATQVAEASGNPSAVGLSATQQHRAQMAGAEINRTPIPVYDNENYPEYANPAQGMIDRSGAPAPQALPQQEQDLSTGMINRDYPDPTGEMPAKYKIPSTIPGEPQPVDMQVREVTKTVKLPNGEVKTMKVPESWGELEVKRFLIEKGVEGLEGKKGDLAIERFKYEFSKGDNITTNVGDYMKSHFPNLANELVYREENGWEYRGAEEIYGEDFFDLKPQERRERMKKIDRTRLDETYKEAIAQQNIMESRGETDVAGGAGLLGKAVADPAAFVPIAGQVAKVGSVGYKAAAASGAKIGAGYGAAYGASQQLSESGAPTTLAEVGEMSGKMAKEGAMGAVGGAVLLPAAKAVGAGGKKLLRANTEKKLRSSEGRVQLTKEYYNKVWMEQAAGKTSAEADTIARRKLKLTVDDVFQMRLTNDNPLMNTAMNGAEAMKRMNQHGMTRFSNANRAKNRAVSAFDNYVTPLDAVMRDINPWAAQRMRNADGNVLRKQHSYHEGVVDFFKGYKSMSKQDKATINMALMSNDLKGAKNLYIAGRGVKMGDAFDRMISTVKRLGDEMERSGIKYDSINQYFPRHVKDVRALKAHLKSKMKDVGFAKVLKRAQKRNGGKMLSESQEIKLLNRYMSGGRVKNRKLVGSTKKRTVARVTPEILKYYGDAVTALDMHIRSGVQAIERNNLFDGHMKMTKDGLEDIDTSIGNWLRSNGVDNESIDRLAPLFQARFGKGEQSGYRLLANARTFVGGVTLGNPYSAIRQLGDNFVAAWQYGIIPTIRSMPEAAMNTMKQQLGIPNEAKITADTFGFMNEMAQELDTGGVTSRWIKSISNNMYKYGGFKTIDRLGKNVLMGTALRTARKSQTTEKARRKFIEKYSASYEGAEMQALMGDLKAGKLTDIVKQHIMAEVMEIQPISRSQMPQAYLNHPNGRMMYQFRTWGIKQFDLARRQVFQKLYSGNMREKREGAGALVLLTAYVGLGNVGITELQRLFTGRDTKMTGMEDLGNDLFGQILGNFAINRYGLDKLAGDGKTDEFFLGMVPPSLEIPMNMGASALKLLGAEMGGEPEEASKWTKELRKTTGIGRLLDFWVFGGAELENKKIYDEQRKNMGLSQ